MVSAVAMGSASRILVGGLLQARLRRSELVAYLCVSWSYLVQLFFLFLNNRIELWLFGATHVVVSGVQIGLGGAIHLAQ
jgi:hypothetical protein